MKTEYTPEFEAHVAAWAKDQLEPKRIPHVEGVVATCARLAEQYAPDQVRRARLAGWLHDAAKRWSPDDLLRYAETRDLPISEAERAVPMLLHGVVGYAIAAERFGLDDPALMSACAKHTTGDPDMSLLDKIVFLGDLIEPSRDFPGVDTIRADADADLDRAILRALDHTLSYLILKQRQIDPRPVHLRNHLLAAGVGY